MSSARNVSVNKQIKVENEFKPSLKGSDSPNHNDLTIAESEEEEMKSNKLKKKKKKSKDPNQLSLFD